MLTTLQIEPSRTESAKSVSLGVQEKHGGISLDPRGGQFEQRVMGFWGLSHPAMLSMVMAGVKKEKPVGLTTGFVQLGSFDHLSSPSWTLFTTVFETLK